MSTTYNANELFKALPAAVKEKIFDIAAGKLVYFPAASQKEPVDRVTVCEGYAKGKSFGEVADQFRISRARAWQIVKQERAVYSKDRSRFWQERGLSLRQIARLFKKSHVAIRGIDMYSQKHI